MAINITPGETSNMTPVRGASGSRPAANFSTPELAEHYGGGAPVYEVVLSNGRTAYTTDPSNRFVASSRPLAASQEEEEAEFDAAGAANIKNLLTLYGLDELVPLVDQWVRQGLSWSEIEVMLRDPSTQAGKVVDRLYPEIRLRREAGRAPMSIAEIQQYRTNAREMMRAQGVPDSFFDEHSDFSKWIVDDVSLVELKDRVDEYSTFGAQLMAGPDAARELESFERFYGVKVSPFEVAALALDTSVALPALKRRMNAVRMDVAAGRAGFGDLSVGEAERLVDVGVSGERAQAGFNVLADSRELFDALPGMERVEDQIGRDSQFAAVFEGDAGERQRIEDRAQRRRKAFEGGGAFSSGRDGFEGIGSAR